MRRRSTGEEVDVARLRRTLDHVHTVGSDRDRQALAEEMLDATPTSTVLEEEHEHGSSFDGDIVSPGRAGQSEDDGSEGQRSIRGMSTRSSSPHRKRRRPTGGDPGRGRPGSLDDSDRHKRNRDSLWNHPMLASRPHSPLDSDDRRGSHSSMGPGGQHAAPPMIVREAVPRGPSRQQSLLSENIAEQRRIAKEAAKLHAERRDRSLWTPSLVATPGGAAGGGRSPAILGTGERNGGSRFGGDGLLQREKQTGSESSSHSGSGASVDVKSPWTSSGGDETPSDEAVVQVLPDCSVRDVIRALVRFCTARGGVWTLPGVHPMRPNTYVDRDQALRGVPAERPLSPSFAASTGRATPPPDAAATPVDQQFDLRILEDDGDDETNAQPDMDFPELDRAATIASLGEDAFALCAHGASHVLLHVRVHMTQSSVGRPVLHLKLKRNPNSARNASSGVPERSPLSQEASPEREGREPRSSKHRPSLTHDDDLAAELDALHAMLDAEERERSGIPEREEGPGPADEAVNEHRGWPADSTRPGSPARQGSGRRRAGLEFSSSSSEESDDGGEGGRDEDVPPLQSGSGDGNSMPAERRRRSFWASFVQPFAALGRWAMGRRSSPPARRRTTSELPRSGPWTEGPLAMTTRAGYNGAARGRTQSTLPSSRGSESELGRSAWDAAATQTRYIGGGDVPADHGDDEIAPADSEKVDKETGITVGMVLEDEAEAACSNQGDSHGWPELTSPGVKATKTTAVTPPGGAGEGAPLFRLTPMLAMAEQLRQRPLTLTRAESKGSYAARESKPGDDAALARSTRSSGQSPRTASSDPQPSRFAAARASNAWGSNYDGSSAGGSDFESPTSLRVRRQRRSFPTHGSTGNESVRGGSRLRPRLPGQASRYATLRRRRAASTNDAVQQQEQLVSPVRSTRSASCGSLGTRSRHDSLSEHAAGLSPRSPNDDRTMNLTHTSSWESGRPTRGRQVPTGIHRFLWRSLSDRNVRNRSVGATDLRRRSGTSEAADDGDGP